MTSEKTQYVNKGNYADNSKVRSAAGVAVAVAGIASAVYCFAEGVSAIYNCEHSEGHKVCANDDDLCLIAVAGTGLFYGGIIGGLLIAGIIDK